MKSKKLLLVSVLVIFVSFIFGCGKSTPEQSFIIRVNQDNKCFKGSWVYKSQMGGEFTYPVRTKINIEVDGGKFHLIGKWGESNPPHERRTEEWIYDGKILWQFEPEQKQISWFEINKLRKVPFWKMAPQVKPFAPPKETDKEEIIAGRICKVLQTKGKYDQGDVTLTYWIDKEKNLLLKKEHLLEAAGMILVREAYECESIEFNPVFSGETFGVNIPSDWVKVKKRYLDSELLDTKF